MGRWMYYSVFFDPGGSMDDPHMVVRMLREHPMYSAERLDRSGVWLRTAVLLDIERGERFELEMEEITHERAAAFARQWYHEGLIAGLPEDLVS